MFPFVLQLYGRPQKLLFSAVSDVFDQVIGSDLPKGPDWPAGVWWESKKQKGWQVRMFAEMCNVP
jgi:hypothetical protein